MADLTEDFTLSHSYLQSHCCGKIWPLPRHTNPPPSSSHYEIIIAGAGPTGLMLSTCLARYGLTSILTIDSKPREVDIGHADGIHARTQEILATMSLHDVQQKGHKITKAMEWTRINGLCEFNHARPFHFAPARFNDLNTLSQGRVERMFTREMANYDQRVSWNTEFVNARLDDSDSEYPVVVTLQDNQGQREVRTKYLVGTDGAHSLVRKSAGIAQTGHATDEIWGVMDFVAETDWPGIRSASLVYDAADPKLRKQDVLTIPREKLSNGDWLSRFYVAMSPAEKNEVAREDTKSKRAQISQEEIMRVVKEKIAPYEIDIKQGTKPLWWATYCAGQYLADTYFVKHDGHPRIILAGDAAHNHSPRQGQGMNMGIMDAYYLSWRLAYVVNGLIEKPIELLQTYEDERRPWAYRVVTTDKRWNQDHIDMRAFWAEAVDQITGCGVEEEPGLLVSDKNNGVNWKEKNVIEGVLRTGRRLFNVPVTRWADGDSLDLHDDFPADGRYRILLLAGRDFPGGQSKGAMEEVCELAAVYEGVLEEVIVHPRDDVQVSWKDLPAVVKKRAEMRVHVLTKAGYETYAVDPEKGAIALVRPDGMVAVTASLDDVAAIEATLLKVLGARAQVNGTNLGNEKARMNGTIR